MDLFPHSQTLASAYESASLVDNHIDPFAIPNNGHVDPFAIPNNVHIDPFAIPNNEHVDLVTTGNQFQDDLDLGEELDVRTGRADQVGQLNYNLAVQDILSSLRTQCSEYATKLNVRPQRLLYSVLNISEKEKKSRKLNEWQAWVHLTAKDLSKWSLFLSRSLPLPDSRCTELKLVVAFQNFQLPAVILRQLPMHLPPRLLAFKSSSRPSRPKLRRERLPVIGHPMLLRGQSRSWRENERRTSANPRPRCQK